MTDIVGAHKTLEIPRGDPGLGSLLLDMTKIYEAESRISETRVSNPATSAELTSVFNEACSVSTKYIAWVKYEILKAKRNYDLAKATVIIDKLPDEIAKLKESGLKDNADFRSALIDRDVDCRKYRDISDALEAVKSFLEAKVKTFERSYWDSKENTKKLINPAATGQFNHGDVDLSSPVWDTAESKISQSVSPGGFIGFSKF